MPFNNFPVGLGSQVRASHAAMSEWLPIVNDMKVSAKALEKAARKIGNQLVMESAINTGVYAKNLGGSLQSILKTYGKDLARINQQRATKYLISARQEQDTFQNYVEQAQATVVAAENATQSNLHMNGAEMLKARAADLKCSIRELQANQYSGFEHDITEMYPSC